MIAVDDVADDRVVDRGAPVRGPTPAVTVSAPAVAPARVKEPSATAQIGYIALTVTAVLAASVVIQLVVVSGLQHRSGQQAAYDQFRKELAKGTAPLGSADQGHLLTAGAPVALLDIPSIHVHQVVLEGTTSGILMSGPGHSRGTPLPGQAGTSVIYGRQASFGGPFARLDGLQVGRTIKLTTGEGISTFRVIGRRYAGALVPPSPAQGQGRLMLVTASGTPYVPSGVLRVDADLTSQTFATPAGSFPAGVLRPAERIMATDTGTLWTLVLWLQALILAAIGIVWSWNRWGRHQTWIVFLPVTALIGFFVSGQALKLLPNLL